MPFESLDILVYSADSAPVALASYHGKLEYKAGLKNYIRYTYVINPIYRAFKEGIQSGVYLVADLIPVNYADIISKADVEIRIENTELIGFRTPGWPKNLFDVNVLINLPNETAIDFCFLTRAGGNQTGICHSYLEILYSVLSSVVLKEFEIDETSFKTSKPPRGLEDRFQDFGSDMLTNREQEVVKLILVGHSSNSIALNLAIGLSTVKSHRQNIYRKLQISSQAELFNLFLSHLR